MDPPIVNEASFSAANPASYSLSEIWPFTMAGTGGDLGGLGLRMGNFSRLDGDAAAPAVNHGDVSVAESTVTEQSGSRRGGGCGGGGRKRKDVNSEDESSKFVSSCSANDLHYDSNGKRMKASGLNDENGCSKAEAESSSKSGVKPTEQSCKPEPPKDYIHVRARRGQATDSHSLAERARREKITERMKILQDLVPGCNKVIGKAIVLDEIINYIQSLQHQVEFLSMKLEAVNSSMTSAIESFPSKELAAPSFDTTGMVFGSQAQREINHLTQPEWLHMQIGSSSFERAA